MVDALFTDDMNDARLRVSRPGALLMSLGLCINLPKFTSRGREFKRRALHVSSPYREGNAPLAGDDHLGILLSPAYQTQGSVRYGEAHLSVESCT